MSHLGTSNEHNLPKANFLTIDLEDWYRLMGQYFGVNRDPGHAAFERQVDIVLETLERSQCNATFFVLGSSVADRPQIVKRIVDNGHEIASHGWGHELISEIGLRKFRIDLQRSIQWLEDLIGRKVLGYRAPRFSIRNEQLERFLDICFECGLIYDSSVFPINGWRYGIGGQHTRPVVVRDHNSRRMLELPIATLRWLGKNWPVGGGGWWRLLPYPLISYIFNVVEDQTGCFMTYFHPCEFDSEPLVARKVVKITPRTALWSLQQNLGQQTTREKVEKILSKKKLISVESYLSKIKFQ